MTKLSPASQTLRSNRIVKYMTIKIDIKVFKNYGYNNNISRD